MNYYNKNGKQANEKLFTQQYKILKAFRAGDKNLVKKKQYELTRSFAACAIAIKKITSIKGTNTAGVDGITLSIYNQKMEYISKLKNYQTLPVRRIFIFKREW
jgi:RNA-directed DNA polymerase